MQAWLKWYAYNDWYRYTVGVSTSFDVDEPITIVGSTKDEVRIEQASSGVFAIVPIRFISPEFYDNVIGE